MSISGAALNGMLINNADGDYFIEEGNLIRVQDFHVNTPMIDADFNGTFDLNTTALEMEVKAYDIDVKRFEGKLPKGYKAEGHGKFSGKASGSLDSPIFNGTLEANNLVLNGVTVSDVAGRVGLKGEEIAFTGFGFKDGTGTYKVEARGNYVSGSISGFCVAEKVEVANLLKLSGVESDKIKGTLDSTIEFGGTLDMPNVDLIGRIESGTIGGCDIHDVEIDMSFVNNLLSINKFSGYQGESGILNAVGTADLSGPVNIKLDASNMALEMVTRSAGLDLLIIQVLRLS